MYSMNRRLKKVEERLNVDKEERPPVTIVYFGGGECPPDRTDGNMTIHHVKYEDIISDSAKSDEKQRKATNSGKVG